MNSAGFDLAIGAARRVLIDTSTILAFVNGHEVAHEIAVHLFSRIADAADPIQGYYSAVSVAECLVRPYQVGTHAVATMAAILQGFPHLRVLRVDYAIGDLAAILRARANLRLPDALIAATGIARACDAVVANDEKWPRLATLYPAIRWLYLDAYR